MKTDYCDKCVNMYLKIIRLKEDIEDLKISVSHARFFIFLAGIVGYGIGIAVMRFAIL